MKGKGSGTNTQAFASTAFTGSTSSILSFTQNGATSLGATLGGLTRAAGSTVDMTLPTTGTVSSSTTTATGTNKINGNGIAYSTANGGTTWLVNTSGVLTALGAGSYQTDLFAASGDTDVTANDTPAAFTVNTLRFNTASKTLTLNSSGVSTVTAGGILITSSGTGSVIASGGTGASLTAGATGKEIVVHDYADLNISAPITNNGANVVLLTLAGTGATTLSGANTFTGGTSVDAGTTKLGIGQNGTTSGPLGTGVGAVTVNTGATLDLSTFNTTVANLGGSGTITSSAAAGSGGTLTDTGSTSISAELLNGSLAFLSVRQNDNTSDLSITNGNNTFSGGLTVRGVNGSNVTGTIGSSIFNTAGGLQNTTTINSIRANSGSTSSLGALGTGTITLDNGQTHWNGGYTIANNVAVTANGGILHFDGGTGTIAGTVSGSGYLVLENGFTSNTGFSGSMSSFSGTLGIDANNVGSVNLSASATGNSSMSLGFFGNSTTTGNVQWTGTGSPTIQLGEVFTGSGSTTTAGLRGSTTGSTTTTYQIGDSTSNTPVFAGVIANGSGTNALAAITKVGTNSQTFAGISTYTGGTTISAGTLFANSGTTSLGTGTVALNGGKLAGNGAVGNGTNALTIAGGVIGAGATATATGTLTTGSETWSNTAGGGMAIKINDTGAAASGGGTGSGTAGSTTGWDEIIMSALSSAVSTTHTFAVTLTAGNIDDFSNSSNYVWQIAQINSGSTPISPGVLATTNSLGMNVSTSGELFTLDTSNFVNSNPVAGTGSNFYLQAIADAGGEELVIGYNATPEPGTAMLVLGGVAPMLMGRRRRKLIATPE